MCKGDQVKLLRAGFRIIRSEDSSGTPRIKELLFHTDGKLGVNFVSQADWYLLEKFPTKAARDRAMAKLLEDDHVISD